MLEQACAQGGGLARRRAPDRDGRQRLGAPARQRSADRRRRRRALEQRPGPRGADDRDHRDHADAQHRGDRAPARPRSRQLGVRIAIDDFGTGYSSLAHLQRFPVDALKIDRSFISGLSHNKEGETLIHTLVQLGKALSIETFAEGIEQQQELSLLATSTATAGRASCSPARSTSPPPRPSCEAPRTRAPSPASRADARPGRRRRRARAGRAGERGCAFRCATIRALRQWAQGTRPMRRGSSTTCEPKARRVSPVWPDLAEGRAAFSQRQDGGAPLG